MSRDNFKVLILLLISTFFSGCSIVKNKLNEENHCMVHSGKFYIYEVFHILSSDNFDRQSILFLPSKDVSTGTSSHILTCNQITKHIPSNFSTQAYCDFQSIINYYRLTDYTEKCNECLNGSNGIELEDRILSEYSTLKFDTLLYFPTNDCFLGRLSNVSYRLRIRAYEGSGSLILGKITNPKERYTRIELFHCKQLPYPLFKKSFSKRSSLVLLGIE